MDKLISVIVPIYKVENFLNKSVESVLNQSYKNFELILVNDGSPDNCPKMCDDWAKKDSRIKVLHKENGGLSSARNAGLNICKGEYIAFLDSDDYLEKDYLKKLLAAMLANDADLVICGLNYVDENGVEIKNNNKVLTPKIYKQQEKFDIIFKDNTINSVVAWNKLYARQIFDKLRYPEGKIHEDEFIIYDVINNCKKDICVITDKLYNYLIRSDSIMGSKRPTEKMLHAIESKKVKLDKLDKNDKNYHYAVEQYLSIFIQTFIKVRSDKELRDKVFKQFKQEYKIYKKDLADFKTKIKCFMFRYLKNLLLIIYKLKK